MRKFSLALFIFAAGWILGWYTHWGADPLKSSQPVVAALPDPATPEAPAAGFTPTAPGAVNDIDNLLQRNAFEAVLGRYETLQRQAGEAAVAAARAQILAHARRRIAGRDFSSAEQLLQLFLVAAYRDVEARVLLAEAYRSQKDYLAAIDQLYEAGGYAYRPDMLQRITLRIRSIVAELVQSLKRNNDQNALLALYQHLTQLEPGHAAWFMGLATTQLALEDKAAARRSLLLVSQDPDVGVQAQAMLSELGPALARLQDTTSPLAVTEVVGIPLHRSGNHFIVDARPAESGSIRLLIDTGASMTIFTPAVLEQRGIRYQNTGITRIFNTANGPVRAPVYRLDALAVGDWQVSQLEIGVLELEGGSAIDGLLGMNFKFFAMMMRL